MRRNGDQGDGRAKANESVGAQKSRSTIVCRGCQGMRFEPQDKSADAQQAAGEGFAAQGELG
ncbi:MAG: hypothetical protein ACKN83_00650, partial [Vulcanococcus sp.]